MKQGFGGSVLATVVVLVLQLCAPAVAFAGSSSQITMHQVIRPLYCTVDVTTDGLQLHVQLVPEVCMRSAKARQLLAETRASLHS